MTIVIYTVIEDIYHIKNKKNTLKVWNAFIKERKRAWPRRNSKISRYCLKPHQIEPTYKQNDLMIKRLKKLTTQRNIQHGFNLMQLKPWYK